MQILTVREIIEAIDSAIGSGEITTESAIYVSTEPCVPNDTCVEGAKPIISICSCEKNKHLVFLTEK